MGVNGKMMSISYKYFKILLIFIVLLLASCSSKQSKPNLDKKSISLTIGYQTPTAQTWGATIIKNQKIFEKKLLEMYPDAEIEIQWFNSSSGVPLVNAMSSGKVQIAFLGDMPALLAGAKSVELEQLDAKIVAIDGKGKNGMNQSIIAPIDGINDISQLKGKEVSVPYGSSAHKMLLQTLKSNNLLNKVTIIDQSVAVGLENVNTGTVDEQIHLHKLTTKQKRRHEPDSLVRIDVPPTIHKEVHVS
ncbi:ABC transporter substrate-binding protein [Geobacillus kaustophilus]|uniref:ABC transporter substrate-binding protein n=1 Tax=Geobacillus TaxID=129337 RepID=UPI0012FDD541|nr:MULTISPECIES: ABC transporter substrate-binding protein [Geobacillus]MED3667779.1 ABC transporter substrate-binding protein [Geobacillus kaustophilus]MED4300022.1 ABC transporter substrate-binding protein [Geobacillus stearothermophilus]NNV00882.1 hypothetical protein [Geobacillus sp. DSP4a]